MIKETCPILKQIKQAVVWEGFDSDTDKDAQKFINRHRARCVDCAMDVMEEE